MYESLERVIQSTYSNKLQIAVTTNLTIEKEYIMSKANISQSRALLALLTTQLRDCGVTGFAYPVEHIARMTPGTLKSCIQWATGTLEHIYATNSQHCK